MLRDGNMMRRGLRLSLNALSVVVIAGLLGLLWSEQTRTPEGPDPAQTRRELQDVYSTLTGQRPIDSINGSPNKSEAEARQAADVAGAIMRATALKLQGLLNEGSKTQAVPGGVEVSFDKVIALI